MQADPIGLKAADLKKPESLNRYSYVQNDPVNFVDRTGTLLQAPDGSSGGACQSMFVTTGWGVDQLGNRLSYGFTYTSCVEIPNITSGGESDDALTRPRSSCGRLVDSILNVAIFPSILGIGHELIALAQAYAANGSEKRNPIDGFQDKYINGGQLGDVYKHVLAHAGAWYLGEQCLVPILCISKSTEWTGNRLSRTGTELSENALQQDIYERDHPNKEHSKEEAEAEIEGDLIGRWIGDQLRVSGNYAGHRNVIAGGLCTNNGYAR